jgi:hypothetical protein
LQGSRDPRPQDKAVQGQVSPGSSQNDEKVEVKINVEFNINVKVKIKNKKKINKNAFKNYVKV